MDVIELFSCCRKGDLERIRFLVEQRDVDVNCRDKWDSTPLYYACLCGHQEVVYYLIGVGARCDAYTFDGERCLYGALTDDIRKTLKQHNLITAHTIRRDALYEFLRRTYETGEYSDVTIVVNGREIHLHRCILSARSGYFCHMFSSKWRNRKTIVINNELVDATAFEMVMRYIYTGRLECPRDMSDHCLRLANNCELPIFRDELRKARQRSTFLQLEKEDRVQIKMDVIEPQEEGRCTVKSDLRDLSETTLPPEMRVWPTEMPFCQRGLPALADICFVVEGSKFMCHKVFFCLRSEYFKALVRDHFHETEMNEHDTTESDSLPTITLHHFSSKVFAVIVSYLYYNEINFQQAEVDTAAEVLYTAEMCLLPGLKRLCGVFLCGKLSTSNAFFFHHLSRFYGLHRLEDHCVAFVAKNFLQMSRMPELREVIQKDAQDVKARQETDSVTFVDELRYHISSSLRSVSDIEEAKDKLVLLEEILEDLGIEA